jgi:hypothetical protein
MKIETDENGYFKMYLENFDPITLVNERGETFWVRMDRSGFKFYYGGKDYSAQNGEVKKIDQ